MEEVSPGTQEQNGERMQIDRKRQLKKKNFRRLAMRHRSFKRRERKNTERRKYINNKEIILLKGRPNATAN